MSVSRWWPGWLDTINDPEHRKTLRYFLTWHFLRSFRTLAAANPLGYGRPQGARRHLRVAAWLLDELTAHELTLSTCTQSDLDRIFAGAPARYAASYNHSCVGR